MSLNVFRAALLVQPVANFSSRSVVQSRNALPAPWLGHRSFGRNRSFAHFQHESRLLASTSSWHDTNHQLGTRWNQGKSWLSNANPSLQFSQMTQAGSFSRDMTWNRSTSEIVGGSFHNPFQPFQSFHSNIPLTASNSSNQDTESSEDTQNKEKGASAAAAAAAGKATKTVVVKEPFMARFTPRRIGAFLASLPSRIRKELHHFWVGTKLLGLNVKTAARVLKRILNGKHITRRERRLLKMTVADVFRMVPLIIFFVVPLLEFALPLVLWVFPDLLPSTFQDKLKKEEARRKQLKAKVEVAKFLQETVEELAPARRKTQASSSGESSESGSSSDGEGSSSGGGSESSSSEEARVDAFAAFMQKVRAGEVLSPEEIVRVSSYFQDEITLDQLERAQLVALCRLLNERPFGTTGYLRYRLKRKVSNLKNDDRLIAEEGVDALNFEELQHACQARGMRSLNMSAAALRRQLSDWLELSLERQVPVTLLIMSRAFLLTARQRKPDKVAGELQEILSALPEELVEEVELKLDSELGAVNNDLKLEVLKRHVEQLEVDIEEEGETQKLIEKTHKDVEYQAQKLSGVITELAAERALDKERAEVERLRKEKEERAALDAAELAAKEAAEKEQKQLEEQEAREREIEAAAHAAVVEKFGDIDLTDSSATMKTEKESKKKAKETTDGVTTTAQVDSGSAVIEDAVEVKEQAELLKQLKAKEGEVLKERKEEIQVDTAPEAGTEEDRKAAEAAAADEEAEALKAAAEAEEKRAMEKSKKKTEVATSRLTSRVGKMLDSLEGEISKVESELGESFHLLDRDHDGIVSVQELREAFALLKEQPDESEMAQILERLDPDADGRISLAEMASLADDGNKSSEHKSGDEKFLKVVADTASQLRKIKSEEGLSSSKKRATKRGKKKGSSTDTSKGKSTKAQGSKGKTAASSKSKATSATKTKAAKGKGKKKVEKK